LIIFHKEYQDWRSVRIAEVPAHDQEIIRLPSSGLVGCPTHSRAAGHLSGGVAA
jgi:hypothetical protein